METFVGYIEEFYRIDGYDAECRNYVKLFRNRLQNISKEFVMTRYYDYVCGYDSVESYCKKEFRHSYGREKFSDSLITLYRYLKKLKKNTIVKMLFIFHGRFNETISRDKILESISTKLDIAIDLTVIEFDMHKSYDIEKLLKALPLRTVITRKITKFSEIYYIGKFDRFEEFDRELSPSLISKFTGNRFEELVCEYMYNKCYSLNNRECVDLCRKLYSLLEYAEGVDRIDRIRLQIRINIGINTYLQLLNPTDAKFKFRDIFNPKIESTVLNSLEFIKLIWNMNDIKTSIKNIEYSKLSSYDNTNIKCDITSETWERQLANVLFMDMSKIGSDPISMRILIDEISIIGIPVSISSKNCIDNPWNVEIEDVSTDEYVCVKTMDNLMDTFDKRYTTPKGFVYNAVIPILPECDDVNIKCAIELLIDSKFMEYLSTIMIRGFTNHCLPNATASLCVNSLVKLLSMNRSDEINDVILKLKRTLTCFNKCYSKKYVKYSKNTTCKEWRAVLTEKSTDFECPSVSYWLGAMIKYNIALTDEQMCHVVREYIRRRIRTWTMEEKLKCIEILVPQKCKYVFDVRDTIEKCPRWIHTSSQYMRRINCRILSIAERCKLTCAVTIRPGEFIDSSINMFSNVFGAEFVPIEKIILNAYDTSSVYRELDINRLLQKEIKTILIKN